MPDASTIPFWQHLIMIATGGLLTSIPTIVATRQHNKAQTQREYDHHEREVLESVIEDVEQYDSAFMDYYYLRTANLSRTEKGSNVNDSHLERENRAADALLSSAPYIAKAKAKLLLIQHAESSNSVENYFRHCSALASRMLDPDNPPTTQTIKEEIQNLQEQKRQLYDAISRSFRSYPDHSNGLFKRISSCVLRQNKER